MHRESGRKNRRDTQLSVPWEWKVRLRSRVELAQGSDPARLAPHRQTTSAEGDRLLTRLADDRGESETVRSRTRTPAERAWIPPSDGAHAPTPHPARTQRARPVGTRQLHEQHRTFGRVHRPGFV